LQIALENWPQQDKEALVSCGEDMHATKVNTLEHILGRLQKMPPSTSKPTEHSNSAEGKLAIANLSQYRDQPHG